MVFITFRAPSLKWEILRPLRSRGPDASPSGGPQCSHAHCELPGVRPVWQCPILSNSGCALPRWTESPARKPGDPKGRRYSTNKSPQTTINSQPKARLNSVVFGLSPIPPEALRAWATRPATLKGRIIQAPFSAPILRNSSSVRLPRAANASLSPRTTILWNRAIRSLPIAVRRQR